jgi:hypothetical protein
VRRTSVRTALLLVAHSTPHLVTDAELEAERLALLAEEQALAVEHERLKSTPNDLDGHRAHRERLKAHLKWGPRLSAAG